MNHHRVTLIVAIVIFLFIAVVGALYIQSGRTVSSVMPSDSGAVACTMDAKMCPDGSYVGRHGSKCEFDACPASATTTFNGSATAVFEGNNILSYSLTYNPTLVAVVSSTTLGTTKLAQGAIIIDISSGSSSVVYFSYEGGRGLTPTEYKKEVLKNTCPTCEVVLANKDNSWLVITNNPSGDNTFSDVLNTLKIQTRVEISTPAVSSTKEMPKPY